MGETPLQRLRRLEAHERPPTGGGAPVAGKAAAVGGILLMLTKGKFLIGALKLGPLFGTFASMTVFAALYARLYGASLAIGFVLLILLHELGHGAAAKALGLRVGAPIFIPFLGAFIALKEQPRSSWVETRVALAGPAAGLAGALLCLAWAAAAPERAGLARALAHITLAINLFNLLPAASLDGDRATEPFELRHWLAALAGLLVLLAATRRPDGALHPLLLMITFVGGWKAWRTRPAGTSARLVDRLAAAGRRPDEAAVDSRHRLAALLMYLGLCSTLALLGAWVEKGQTMP
jgi:Zn-dependent protease